MPSGADRPPFWSEIFLRALLYALAVTALVLWAPGGEHVFIYQAF